MPDWSVGLGESPDRVDDRWLASSAGEHVVAVVVAAVGLVAVDRVRHHTLAVAAAFLPSFATVGRGIAF